MFIRNLNILLAEWIKVPVEGLPPMLDRKLHERLVFTNPDYELRHNRGEWLGNIPAQISCIKQRGRSYLIPRGFLDQFIDLCKRFQVPYKIADRRRYLDAVPIEFHGALKNYQQDAAEAVLEHDCGTLVGGHKSGKTVIALYTIAQRRQPALIIIPKIDLLEGWLRKIESFLQIPRSEVGIFAGGSHQVGKQITIGHTGEVMHFWRNIADKIGYLIVDESQRSPSKVLTNLIPNFDCRYILGLSNTAERKDRLFKLIYYYLGEVVYTINERDAREGRGIIPGKIIARATQFTYPYNSRADYVPMLRELVLDPGRNRIIADDIQAELERGEKPVLILSGDDDQERALTEELARRGIQAESFSRFLPNQQRENDDGPGNRQALPPGFAPQRMQVLFISPHSLANYSHAIKSSVIFLAVPVYFRKPLAAAIRAVCHNDDLSEMRLRVYDYVDTRVGILDNYFRMRSYNYGVHPDQLLNVSMHEDRPFQPAGEHASAGSR